MIRHDGYWRIDGQSRARSVRSPRSPVRGNVLRSLVAKSLVEPHRHKASSEGTASVSRSVVRSRTKAKNSGTHRARQMHGMLV